MVAEGILRYIICGTASLACLFYMIALASRYWQSSSNFNAGLWYFCEQSQGCSILDTHCKYTFGNVATFIPKCDSFNTVRAFALMNVLLSFPGLLFLLVVLFKSDSKVSYSYLYPICFLSAGISGLTAMGIYADKFSPTNGASYDYSFGLLIVGWLASLTTGGLGVLAKLSGA